MDAPVASPKIDTGHFDDLANLLDDMRRSLRQSLDRALSAHGINFMHRRLLIHVTGQDGLSQASLARTLGIERATVGLAIDSLVAKGLVRRSAVSGDRRSWAISATDEGVYVLTKVERITQEVCGHLFRGFSQDEFATLEDFLVRMSGNAASLREGDDRDKNDDGGGREPV